MLTCRFQTARSLMVVLLAAVAIPVSGFDEEPAADKNPQAASPESSDDGPKDKAPNDDNAAAPGTGVKGAETEETRKLTNIQLIDQLADPQKADAAAAALIARGKTAVPDLLGEALEGSELSMRGWAIVCLAEIGGKDADQRLKEMHQDEKQPPLVRTWAAAGRVQLAESTEELLELAKLIPAFPAIGRPVGLRLVASFNSQGDELSAEDLLNATLTVPQLQQPLAPAIIALGADKLTAAMVTAKNQNVRRQAAAYLGTLANKGDEKVATAVIDAYQFDPQAKDAPWTGGPLFIPALKWEKDDARNLVGHLIRWHVWTNENVEGNNRTALQTQLHNNLRSIQLAAAAGYQSPGFQEVDTTRWLTVWGQAIGREELAKLLAEQKLDEKPKYQEVLKGLE